MTSSNSKIKKPNCYITKSQIQSIVNAKDDMTAMLGVAEDDSHWIKYIKNINKFLKNNKFN